MQAAASTIATATKEVVVLILHLEASVNTPTRKAGDHHAPAEVKATSG